MIPQEDDFGLKMGIWYLVGGRRKAEDRFVRWVLSRRLNGIWITSFPPFVMGYIMRCPDVVEDRRGDVIRPLFLSEKRRFAEESANRKGTRLERVFYHATLPLKEGVEFAGKLSSLDRWSLVPGVVLRFRNLGGMVGEIVHIDDQFVLMSVNVLGRIKEVRFTRSSVIVGIREGDVLVERR